MRISRIIESDRITYIYLKLVDTKQKKFIEELIQRLEIASISTARRRFKEMDKWSNSDKQLFLATYIPTKSDSKAVHDVLTVAEWVRDEEKLRIKDDNEAVDDVLRVKASNCITEVKEEPTSEDKCTECDIEADHIINELSAKNEELQKELHTSKNVITTLQKGIEELNETITESKINIAEIGKYRDWETDRKSTRLNSSHSAKSRMPSSA